MGNFETDSNNELWAKYLAASEAFIGAFTMAVIVLVISRKLSRR